MATRNNPIIILREIETHLIDYLTKNVVSEAEIKESIRFTRTTSCDAIRMIQLCMISWS